MATLIKYPDTDQFRHVVKQVTEMSTYAGKDEDGNAIYDPTLPKPVIRFTGTVKLHGTNAAVGLDDNGTWYQSREQIITPEKDNAGFAKWASERGDVFDGIMVQAVGSYDTSGDTTNYNTIILYGEWAGSGINSGCAIHQLPKAFYLFGAKLVDGINTRWLDVSKIRTDTTAGIYNIHNFRTETIDVDFSNPYLAQNRLVELTNEVENECPVAAKLGVSGIGEGWVWTAEYRGHHLLFKTKGEKHSVSKVKTIASVDVEKLATAAAFVDSTVTDERFNQALNCVFGIDGEPDIKQLGEVIKWVQQDILKEETDTIEANGLSIRNLGGPIALAVKSKFFSYMRETQ